MAVFQRFPRLYGQSGQGTTTSYYGGLNRSPTLSSYAGNQNVGTAKPDWLVSGEQGGTLKTGTATSPSPNTSPTPAPVRRPAYNPTTGQMDLGQGTTRYGTSGRNLTDIPGGGTFNLAEGYDPRYYEQYQRDIGDSNTETAWRLRQDVLDRLGNRIQVNKPGVVGRNPDGSIMEGQGFNETLDPNAVEWDDEFGWVMNKDNLSGSDPDDKERWGRIRAAAIAATLGGAAWAGGAFSGMGLSGAGADVVAADMAMPTLTGAADTTLAAAPTITGGGAAASAAGLAGGTMPTIAAPAMEMPALTGAANPALSAAPNLNGGFPWSTAGRAALNIGGGLANWYLGNRTQSGMTAAADRADPYGQYRERGATNLHALEADPDSVTRTPQYQFLRQQGEQGIERVAAKTGYFRSPNMLFDLSKFNQGLASQEYNREWERRAAEAGVNFTPYAGGNLQAQGVTGSNNMRAAAGSQLITQIVNSTPDFYNWLFGA